MPSTRRRVQRRQKATLEEEGFIYFGEGNYFDRAAGFAALPEAERWAFWRAHRAAIIEAFHAARPDLPHLKSWGEVLEAIKRKWSERAAPCR
jgi:hypothetical protein